MRGHGLGGFFSSLFRRALPFLQLGAKYAGKKLVRTGANVLDDIIEGHEPKTALKNNVNILRKSVVTDIKKKMKGKGRKKIGKLNNKRKRKKNFTPQKAKKIRAVTCSDLLY